jgi:hypothetical protein
VGCDNNHVLNLLGERVKFQGELDLVSPQKILTNLHQRFPKGLGSKREEIKLKSHVSFYGLLSHTNSLKHNLCLSMERLLEKGGEMLG